MAAAPARKPRRSASMRAAGSSPTAPDDAGAASHPVGQVEAGQPTFLLGPLVQLAAGGSDGHGLGGPDTT